MGFDLVGCTVTVIGTGKIATVFARIMAGFGSRVIGFDVHHSAPDASSLSPTHSCATI
jgi:D-lactate dehydrogenase